MEKMVSSDLYAIDKNVIVWGLKIIYTFKWTKP